LRITQVQIFRYPIRHLGVVRRPAPLGAKALKRRVARSALGHRHLG